MEKLEEIIHEVDLYQKKTTLNSFKKYLKYWYLFLIFGVLGTTIGFLIYKYSPNTYEIQSRILVKEQNEQLNSILPSQKDNTPSVQKVSNLENKLGILESYTLFRKALMNLNWEVSWYEKGLGGKTELYKNEPFELHVPKNAVNVENVFVEIVPLNDEQYQVKINGEANQDGKLQEINIKKNAKFGIPFQNEYFNFTLDKKSELDGGTFYLMFNNINTLTKQYLNKTNVKPNELGSNLITISIEGQNIQKEADFINELNEVLIQFGLENKVVSSKQSLEFIESQLSRIKTKLKTSENNFSNFRESNNVMNLSQEAQIIYAKLEKIDNEKYMTQLQINYYTELLKYLDNSEKISEMASPSVVGIDDRSLASMLGKLMELYSEREVLSFSVKEKNPSFQIVEKEIKIARDGLEETVKNQLKATESMLASIETRYANIEKRIKKLPQTEKQLIGIQREFDLNNELYTYLLQKRAEASLAQASIMPEVQIIDRAMEESSEKIGPSLIKNAGGGLLGGLILAFLIIGVSSFFRTSVETRAQVEALSAIPVLDGIVKHGYKSRLPILKHPHSGISESFRGLKTNINTILNKHDCKVISVNSLIPGEGKSFLSAGLSVTIARGNYKILLVNADMHKPMLQSYLEMDNKVGLTEYLKNEKNLEEIISKTKFENMDVIQAGPVQKNPSDLLDSQLLKELIKRSRANYDYIIIDNAPLLLIPDAISTSILADISLFVVRVNHSHIDEVKQINRLVKFNRLKQAAIVMNGSPDRGYDFGKKYWKKGYGDYRAKMSIA